MTIPKPVRMTWEIAGILLVVAWAAYYRLAPGVSAFDLLNGRTPPTSATQNACWVIIGLCVVALIVSSSLVGLLSVRKSATSWHGGKLGIVFVFAATVVWVGGEILSNVSIENASTSGPWAAAVLGLIVGATLTAVFTPLSLLWTWLSAREKSRSPEP